MHLNEQSAFQQEYVGDTPASLPYDSVEKEIECMAYRQRISLMMIFHVRRNVMW